MRALVINAPGQAAVVDRPEPRPEAGEVLVRVARAGLCGTDLSIFAGKNPLVEYPRVIGHEIAGFVEAMGSGVDRRWTPGVRVALNPYKNCGTCRACRLGRPNACRDNQTLGVQRDGALAEYVAIPASRLLPSSHLSVDHLALVEPFSIGMHAVNRGQVGPGEWVGVIGCGGVGAGAVAAAAARGARVVGVDVDARKLDRVGQLGAEILIDASRSDALAEMRRQTGVEGLPVIIEAAGTAPTYQLALDLAASCGRVVCIGWVKGAVPLEVRHVVAKELEVLGSRNATSELAEVIGLFESGTVDPLPLVTHRVALDEGPEMLARWAAEPATVGKVLVTVDR